MKAVYPKVKAADPDATVIVGALAPTGDRDDPTVLGDLIYIQRLYDAGVRGYFDALGSHPYAASNPPDAPNSESGLELNRAREQREVLVRNGDDKPLWATEFGWLVNTSCDLGIFNHFKVSEELQAQYLVRAFEKARTEWPWLHGMFIFNLDFGLVHPECEPMRFFSLLHRTPPNTGPIIRRPAVEALKNMPKR